MKQFLTTALILITSAFAFAQQEGTKEKKRYEYFKERNISRTYTASGNKLRIDNNFGAVKVITWDRNEIKVDIHIEVSSNNKEVAEKTFNNLEVEESTNAGEYQFETKTDNAKNKNNYNCKNCNVSMSIDYEVHIPGSTALKVFNSFGPVTIPDYNGLLSLICNFGTLTTGSINKCEKLQVEFSTANIKSLRNCSAVFKFSEVNIENLSGSNKINMEFCSSSSINLDNDLTGLTMNESYSTVNLRPASNLSANYHIRTSFSSVKDRSNANIQRTDKPDQYGPDSERTYEGKSGSGAAKIEIKSSFGTIIIGQATEEEMKRKEKTKKKAV
jgi:hypothetical protein